MSAPIKREDIRKGDRIRVVTEFTSGNDWLPMAADESTYELIERPVTLPTELGVYTDKDGGLWSFQTNGYLALKSASAAGWFTADHMRQFAPFTLLRPVAEVAAEVLAEVRTALPVMALLPNPSFEAVAAKWATK